MQGTACPRSLGRLLASSSPGPEARAGRWHTRTGSDGGRHADRGGQQPALPGGPGHRLRRPGPAGPVHALGVRQQPRRGRRPAPPAEDELLTRIATLSRRSRRWRCARCSPTPASARPSGSRPRTGPTCWSSPRTPTGPGPRRHVPRLRAELSRAAGSARPGAQAAQLLDEVGVAAVDVVHVLHLGDAVGDQPGQHEPGAGPDVGGHDRGAGEPLRPRTTAWWPSMRTSAPSRTSSLTNMNRPRRRSR